MLTKVRNLLFQIRKSISKKGPYRFLIKSWQFTGDINLASKVIGTEFFRDSIEPVQLPYHNFKKYVVISPHQDDETIGTGGLLAFLKDQNAEVSIIYTSNGSQTIPGYTPEEIVSIRNEEAKKALSYVNAKFFQLNIDNQNTAISISDVNKLATLIADLKPEIILIPWLLDSPAKHRLANHLLWLSNKIIKISGIEIWGYQVHNTLYPNGYIDITAKIEVKRKMLECFQSQNLHFQCYDHLAIGMAAWNSRFLPKTIGDLKKKYAEVFFCLPAEEYFDFITKYYFQNFNDTYKGNAKLIKTAKSLHEEIINKKI